MIQVHVYPGLQYNGKVNTLSKNVMENVINARSILIYTWSFVYDTKAQ